MKIDGVRAVNAGARLGSIIATAVVALAIILACAQPSAAACRSPKAIGVWIGANDVVSNEIREIVAISDGENGQVMGWLYVPRNRKTYFQPALVYGHMVASGKAVSIFVRPGEKPGGPAIPVSSRSLQAAGNAIKRMISSLGVSQNALPANFRGLMANRRSFSSTKCRT